MMAMLRQVRRRRFGFTLIELLVVMAVIAILASLISRGLVVAKRKAQSIQCVNNVRQLGLGFALYVADQGLPWFSATTWPLIEGDWHFYLRPSDEESRNVRLCPATRENSNKRPAAPRPPGPSFDLNDFIGTSDMPYRLLIGLPELHIPPKRWISSSYGLNNWTRRVSATATMEPLFFGAESTIRWPSLTPLFGDSASFTAGPVATNTPARDLYSPNAGGVVNIADFQVARHGKRGPARRSWVILPGRPLGPWVNNLVFYDGHVERVKLDNLWNYYWHKGYEPPTTRPR